MVLGCLEADLKVEMGGLSIFGECRGLWGLSLGPLAWSWAVSGRSWEGSWEGLGRSWEDLGVIFRATQFSIDFWIDFGHQKGAKSEAFWEPKLTPNRSENGIEI